MSTNTSLTHWLTHTARVPIAASITSVPYPPCDSRVSLLQQVWLQYPTPLWLTCLPIAASMTSVPYPPVTHVSPYCRKYDFSTLPPCDSRVSLLQQVWLQYPTPLWLTCLPIAASITSVPYPPVTHVSSYCRKYDFSTLPPLWLTCLPIAASMTSVPYPPVTHVSPYCSKYDFSTLPPCDSRVFLLQIVWLQYPTPPVTHVSPYCSKYDFSTLPPCDSRVSILQ